MRIYIPTLSRYDNIQTIKLFPKQILAVTTLVVQAHEYKHYAKYEDKCRVLVLPEYIKTIAPTREYINNLMEDEYIFHLDDDLKFFIRKSKDDWHLRYMLPSEYITMFRELLQWLRAGYAHVGISAREGNNRQPSAFVENTRYMRCYGYNLNCFSEIKYCRCDGMEDFDTSLQLLKLGYPSKVSFFYAQGQGSSNAVGGCSNWRTIKSHSDCAKKLGELHSPFVKVVEKQTKTAWNGNATRLDVIISWEKAFKYGMELKEGDV